MAGSSSSAVVEWGNKQAGTDSSYESMCFKGVWYNLYDCVFCRSGRSKPYVGKLMRLYEEQGVKKVRIRWFFRPDELPLFVSKDLSSDVAKSKELFVGLGSGKGVENENLVEVICGKAIVLCTARFRDNSLPSQAHVDHAHHFFNRAYDVGKKKLVKIINIDNKPLVQKMCNKREWLLPIPNEHVGDFIEESCESIVVSEEKKSSNVWSISSASGEKQEPLHPIQKVKVNLEDCNMQDCSSSLSFEEKEKLVDSVSITSLSGKKRIMLKTSPIESIATQFKKKKII